MTESAEGPLRDKSICKGHSHLMMCKEPVWWFRGNACGWCAPSLPVIRAKLGLDFGRKLTYAKVSVLKVQLAFGIARVCRICARLEVPGCKTHGRRPVRLQPEPRTLQQLGLDALKRFQNSSNPNAF